MALETYRPNAGIMIINDKIEVLVGQRAKDTNKRTWQMPQGGIDSNETPIESAYRELFEETGIKDVRLIAQSQHWYTYDFPQWVVKEIKKPFKGQTQKWFLFLYTGKSLSQDLKNRKDKELYNFKWVKPETLPVHVIDFKKHVYKQVLLEFSPYLKKQSGTTNSYIREKGLHSI